MTLSEVVPAGATVVAPQPGDFFLTHETGTISALVRFGQRIRGLPPSARAFNHTGIFVGADGTIVEALGSGVLEDNIVKHQQRDYVVVRLGDTADARQRAAAVAFAKARVGDSYGWLTIVSIVIGLLTGSKLVFSHSATEICSGLVARALERTDLQFDCDAVHIMPGDLAVLYSVV